MSLCRESDPELWFSTARSKIEKAKSICNQCPAREACLAEALREKIEYGIWGGKDETERRAIVNPHRPYKRKRSTLPIPEDSEIRGVSWNRSKGRWSVALWFGGKMHWLGTYADQADAEAVAIARCQQWGTSIRRQSTGKKLVSA